MPPSSKFRKDGSPRKKRNTPPVVHELLAESEGGLRCLICLDFLSPASFAVNRQVKRGRYCYCKRCSIVRREESKEKIRLEDSRLYQRKREEILAQAANFSQANPKTIILRRARGRASQHGFVCTITEDDFEIPTHCPVFGFPLEPNRGKGFGQANSPSIDRIRPHLGYVPGNVQVISYKANCMKWAHSLEDWEKFAKWILGVPK